MGTGKPETATAGRAEQGGGRLATGDGRRATGGRERDGSALSKRREGHVRRGSSTAQRCAVVRIETEALQALVGGLGRRRPTGERHGWRVPVPDPEQGQGWAATGEHAEGVSAVSSTACFAQLTVRRPLFSRLPWWPRYRERMHTAQYEGRPAQLTIRASAREGEPRAVSSAAGRRLHHAAVLSMAMSSVHHAHCLPIAISSLCFASLVKPRDGSTQQRCMHASRLRPAGPSAGCLSARSSTHCAAGKTASRWRGVMACGNTSWPSTVISLIRVGLLSSLLCCSRRLLPPPPPHRVPPCRHHRMRSLAASHSRGWSLHHLARANTWNRALALHTARRWTSSTAANLLGRD
ncbi:hypothetical protein P171DRAFT_441751 [Karstenula rhodostoma CBS 690.94]|uniref:Uncharacterized protein n=1 Tax=Karstenula rhodostoma CBS 690.94 TaxID=1392251 RepID=A0A9P4PR54_9PLEO|nr:hypothetical protein P171DRAFT_441751 [Karstenula rhodostoma CBS 690.94]